MMANLGLVRILPLIGLGLALWKKIIIPALVIDGLAASLLLSKSGFELDYLDRAIQVTGDHGSLQLILFGLLVGGLHDSARRTGDSGSLSPQVPRMGHSVSWFLCLLLLRRP